MKITQLILTIRKKGRMRKIDNFPNKQQSNCNLWFLIRNLIQSDFESFGDGQRNLNTTTSILLNTRKKWAAGVLTHFVVGIGSVTRSVDKQTIYFENPLANITEHTRLYKYTNSLLP